MSIVILAIGTVLSIGFLVLLFKGQQYDYLVEPLDSDVFPLKFLYSVGFCLGETKLLRLRGKLGARLRDSATLFYGKKYGEFYARAIWAQVLSYPLVCAAVLFVIAGLFSGDMCGFFAVVGVFLAAISAYYFFTHHENKLKERRSACEGELPNAISKLALLMNSGVTLHEAWKIVAFGKEGTLYELMRQSCEAMDNGRSEIDALYDFGALSNSPDVKKFTSALIQSIERGGEELPIFLANQSGELWEQHRQRLLQKGEQAASALLMPIALMFFGVMLIVITSALQSFSL
jgi:tight adherence protein C